MSYKRVLLSLAGILLPQFVAGQPHVSGTKATAMGNAFVAYADNVWATNVNPAGLQQLFSLQASLFVAPAQFGLPELRTFACAAGLPLDFVALGVAVEQFGFELYKETNIRLGFARNIDWGVSAGVAINIRRFDIAGYGSTTNALIDVGLLAEAHPTLIFGFSMKNLAGAKMGTDSQRLPQTFFLGARYVPIKSFTVAIELEKESRHQPMLKVGLEQRVLGLLSLRAGVTDDPNSISAGFGAGASLFEFSYAGSSHPELGWSHQLELAIRLHQE